MTQPPENPLRDVSSLHAVFFEETDEHLAAIEEVLVRLDLAAPDTEDLNAIFRAAHSIKGSSVMLGFPEIGALTHIMESLLDSLRKGERVLAQRDVDAMLRAGDAVKMQVAFRKGALAEPPDMRAVEDELRALADSGAREAARPRRYSVRLGPLAEPIDESELDKALAGLEEMGSVRRREVSNFAGGEVRFDVSLAGAEADLRSVLSLLLAPELVEVTRLDGSDGARAGDAAPAPGESVTEDAGFDVFVAPHALRGRRASDRQEATPGDAERYGRRESDRQLHGGQADASWIRVKVEKIDRLVNLVGELVITEAILAQQYGNLDEDLGHSELTGLRDLARHTRNLQEAVMSIRMVPISAVFSRLPRLARELSQRLGKEVELRISGEATELDRSLIEKITDPLIHLVRNAIDHGLESAQARAGAGKPRCGVVSVSARQRGENVVIEVRDDGHGLDRERILACAAERGIAVAPGASDQEVWQLIFEPGFSTAGSVTEVSGRGVGMDVVRRNIQLLRGNVELASRPGEGTTVTVSVPLTLAIIEAMTVGVGGETYALPLASVLEVRRVRAEDIRGVAGQGLTLRVRDDYLPVQSLGKGDIAIIVESEGSKAALLVDELVGQQQIVVKSLETNFRRVPGISGATIMGDGRVALILDIAHTVGQADRGSRVRH